MGIMVLGFFQVTQVGGDSLIIHFFPADVGKPTVRLEKAGIRDGSCSWENPVYETVKFFREPKTGTIQEKIYTFVVSTGSSKAGLIGEVSIDFASYAYSIKLSTVSLPLKNAKSEPVLHVSIQRMEENIEQREAEEIENGKIYMKDRSFKALLSIGDPDESNYTEVDESNYTEDEPLNKRTSHIAELNGNRLASSGSDLTISSSNSSSGLDTPRQFGLDSSNMLPDPTSLLSSSNHNSVHQKTISDLSTRIHEDHQTPQWEWMEGSTLEGSTDDSSSGSREKSDEASDITIEKLKTELAALCRQAEVSELELQTLRKQIVREGKRGNDLFREVVGLKEERDAFKAECENLKAFQRRMDEAKVQNKLKSEGGDPFAIVEELRQELSYEKDLNANLRLQLEKTQESNSELILAVRDLDEILERKDREIINLSNGSAIVENVKHLSETSYNYETEDDEEQKALEELVLEHSESNGTHEMERKITDLYNELEIYRKERDEIEVQMEQLALDYEILKQENHELSYKLEQSQVQEQLKMQYECSSSYASINELETQIENMEVELKNQSEELSASLASINKLETIVKSLEEELEKQAEGFEADIEILTCAKVEQEQRAIRAEEALRKMRWQNANMAERLQEEFKRLSLQLSSTFEENEKLAMKALTEASELRLQKIHLEELLRKEKEELESVRDEYEAKLHELLSQISLKVNQMEQMQLEIEVKSKEVESEKRHREESHRIFSQEMLMLGEEIEKLKRENNDLSIEAEQNKTLKVKLERMNMEMEETDLLLFRGNVERDEMEGMIDLLRKETEKSREELNILSSLKDEKESMIGNLQLELEMLKSQCDVLKRSLFEDELEKEKMRKQVFQLKGDLKKKEDAFSSLEKELKDTKTRLTVLDGTKTMSRNNKSVSVPRTKEMASLKDKIKILEGQIKLKEAALETSTNSFLEKEKDLQNKIEELQRRSKEQSQNSGILYEYQLSKVAEDPKHATSNGSTLMESGNAISSEKGLEASASNARDQGNLEELSNEMELLKERNKTMESELKDMQERYSEISLKFAEVEGEREQLVMALRNLKNAKKI
ncbi:hypothetical protein RHGRI_020017 [Rhododendron griersonianum]|uniref:C2 NT-type domain-containing protein n=1 Tax=Rhododendron griersonianum TaxID=479676 RepID=A0AAV6JI91_9ERIC|nr:hypothetical protein RHGRI_020017 [Rhododendron griersonianum]